MARLNKKDTWKAGQKLLKRVDEAVGAEEPTEYNKGYVQAIKDFGAELEFKYEDKDWKASAMREEV